MKAHIFSKVETLDFWSGWKETVFVCDFEHRLDSLAAGAGMVLHKYTATIIIPQLKQQRAVKLKKHEQYHNHKSIHKEMTVPSYIWWVIHMRTTVMYFYHMYDIYKEYMLFSQWPNGFIWLLPQISAVAQIKGKQINALWASIEAAIIERLSIGLTSRYVVFHAIFIRGCNYGISNAR